jgi:site-specific DNA recombinase
MSRRSDSELKPRNGHTLIVGIVARISGGQRQKGASLDDQIDNARELIEEIYEGPVEFKVIACTKGKGEWLDRPELLLIEKAYRSGEYDIIVYDDIGRLIRGGKAAELLGLGVDQSTRSIGIADGIDTADENWEEDTLNACSENVAYVQRASKRIKQKCMNRFKKYGWVAKRPITGYIVPEDATGYDDWRVDESLSATILEGANRLLQHKNCSSVADWFNEINFPRGRYARLSKWTGAKVRHFYENPILKGMPQRGKMHSVKYHGTGHRRSVKNSKGPTYYEAPHLAHLSPEQFDELNRVLAEHNANYRRRGVNGCDQRSGVPRKRTRFPGQHAICWYCGWRCVWGGNGITERLMCSAAREWKCWNSIGFSGGLAAQRVSQVILSEINNLVGIDAQYQELIERALRGDTEGLASRWEALRREESTIVRERENIHASIRGLGHRPEHGEMLDGLRARAENAARERWKLEQMDNRKLVLPASIGELREMISVEFQQLAIESPEFGNYLRQLVPEFHVYMVRLCDGGSLLPRARVKLDLTGSVADSILVPKLKGLLTRVVTIDLFDPVQREAIRPEAVRLATQGLTRDQIAEQLPGKPTSTAVTNAINLDKQMKSLGLSSPYETVLEPPEDMTRLRRHKNARYRFEPWEGYQPPAL